VRRAQAEVAGEEVLLTVQEFADRISASKASVYRLIQSGMPCTRLNGSRGFLATGPFRINAFQAIAWLEHNGRNK
jgi:hypothetical protein